MTIKTALILGATGVVGTHLVKELSNSNNYKEIHLVTRREIESKEPNFEVHVVEFDNLVRYADLFNVTDVFICLGTTIKKANRKKLFVKLIMNLLLKRRKWRKPLMLRNFSS
ncbi:NAD-dependent epimerase/dehydratase family protein [Peribacillus butanolivorans]|uniref:NAD-dependent epimerase/dehydratase family protein n=1 Tax=Peribacillus butanolivorans TaxID=421767 RepID=UPI00363A7ED2